MKKVISFFALTAIFAVVAFADIRLPDPPKPPPTGKQMEMMIDITDEVSEPTLVIKKGSAKLLRAALDEAEGIENNLAISESPKSSFATTQTLVGGMFLTIAFLFGGVWFVRSKPSKAAIGIFLFALFAGGTAITYANIAPPRNWGIDKFIFNSDMSARRGGVARGTVRVKIVNEPKTPGGDIKLLIPSGSEKASE